MINPFTYGNPINDPVRFYGRQRELEQIFSRLCNPAFESSSIVGERRIGKTSLLRVMSYPGVIRARGLDPEKYIFVYNDLMMVGESMTPLQLWLRLLRTIRRQIKDPDPELNEIIADMRASRTVDNYLLADFFDLLSDIDLYVVLLLDEFETITYNQNFGPDFFGALRSLAIHHNLALITSSRQELVDLCHSDEVRTSPFFNIFANISLRGLDLVDTQMLLDRSLNGTGTAFTDRERKAIFEIGGGHPFFTQVAAHFMWDAYSEGIAEDSRLDFMRRNFCTELGPHFSDYWQHSTENERIVLTALALMGVVGRGESGHCTEDLVRQSFGRLESMIGQLEKRTLLILREGHPRLISPALEDWVIAQVFDLVGIAAPDFQDWLDKQGVRFTPRMLEILPRITAEHRLWFARWLSDDNSEALLKVVDCFVNGRSEKT